MVVQMKKTINKAILIVLSAIIIFDAFAMQNNDSFTAIPSDIKKEVINYLLKVDSLQDATDNIKRMLANKDLAKCINQSETTQEIIKALAAQFNVNEFTSGAFLGTKTAQELFTKSLGNVLSRNILTKYLIQSAMAQSLRLFSNTPQLTNVIKLFAKKSSL